jgi:hypothetical protein
MLDVQYKMRFMKKKTAALPALQAEYRSLAQSLAQTGFISRGCVFERKSAGSGSRYQWTWKNSHQKTLSLTLSSEQYQWLKEAIARQNKLEKTLKKMRRISHLILLGYVPGPIRRKRLSIRTLGLI